MTEEHKEGCENGGRGMTEPSFDSELAMFTINGLVRLCVLNIPYPSPSYFFKETYDFERRLISGKTRFKLPLQVGRYKLYFSETSLYD